MSFSEFQYSNRQALPFITLPGGSRGETWTKEMAVTGISFRDKLESGRQLTVTISNPQNIHGAKYVAFQRVRVIDRPSNAILFIGRVIDAQNNHRKQILTLICKDYVGDLGDKTVPSANLYGNRRSDISKDVISGGIEYGRTSGLSIGLNIIVDSTKKFSKRYVGRVVKVGGRGPGLVTAYASNIIADSSATGIYAFDNSFIGRLIRKVIFYQGRKVIEWEGRITAVPASTYLTVSANGVDTRLSGGEDYSTAAHGFSSSASPAHYWEVVGYEGTITDVLSPIMVQCSTVGVTIGTPSYRGYKDANFYGWGANTAADGTINGKLGGVDYVIESASDGIFQTTTGQAHTSDKAIDWESRVDKSPYLEYIRKSYGQGQASSEGIRETLQKISREELWVVPQVLFFGGHLDTSLGIAENNWMLGTAEANTGVDLLLKPTKAPLPLQTRVVRENAGYMEVITANNKHPTTGLSSQTIKFGVANVVYADPTVQDAPEGNAGNLNSDAVGSPATVAGTPSGFWDPEDPNKNMIQIGDEVRRVVNANQSGVWSVTVDLPFDKIYSYADDVYVGIGPSVGSPRWEDTTHLGGAPTASQTITGNPDLISTKADGTFHGASVSGWTESGLVGTWSDSYANLTTTNTTGGIGVLWTLVQGIKEDTVYRLTLEVARDVDGSGRTSDDASERKVWIGSSEPYYDSSLPGWRTTNYDILSSINMTSSQVQYSNSNRDAWIQYHFEFSVSGSVYSGLANDGSGTKQVYLSLVVGTQATGTASQSGTTVTGIGTNWSGNIVTPGSDLVFSGGSGGGTLSSINVSAQTATVTTTATVSAQAFTYGSGEKAKFDSVQIRERSYDSRLYIGSPKIFNGIKFDLEASIDVYQGMFLEFWGRDKRDGTFGWHTIEDYHVDDAQTGDLQYPSASYAWKEDRIATDPNLLSFPVGGDERLVDGVRGIDHFNRSGIIKWWDIGFRDRYGEIDTGGVIPVRYTPDWEWPPNTPWNHWPKDNLRNTEPAVSSTKVNTLSTTKHNYSGAGGVLVTGLDDSEYSNLFWVRLSVPSGNIGTGKASAHPGFIKNLRILDGRESSRDEDDTPLYDTTERSLSNAQWDWRVEDPGFFSVIGQVDTTSPSTTLVALTTNLDGAIDHVVATTIDNSAIVGGVLSNSATSVKVDPTTVSTTLDGAIAHTQTTIIDGAIGAASSDTTVVVDVSETKTTLNGAIAHTQTSTIDGAIGTAGSDTTVVVDVNEEKTTLDGAITHTSTTQLDGTISNNSTQAVVVDVNATKTTLNGAITHTSVATTADAIANDSDTTVLVTPSDITTLNGAIAHTSTTSNSQSLTMNQEIVNPDHTNLAFNEGTLGTFTTGTIEDNDHALTTALDADDTRVYASSSFSPFAVVEIGDSITLTDNVSNPELANQEQMIITNVWRNVAAYHFVDVTRAAYGTTAQAWTTDDKILVSPHQVSQLAGGGGLTVSDKTHLAVGQTFREDSTNSDDEVMLITGVSSSENKITVRRGYFQSTVRRHYTASTQNWRYRPKELAIGRTVEIENDNNSHKEQMTITDHLFGFIHSWPVGFEGAGIGSSTGQGVTVTRGVNGTTAQGNAQDIDDDEPIFSVITDIPVTSAAGMVTGEKLKIENEIIEISSISGNTLTVVRGRNSTAIAAHSTADEDVKGLSADLNVGASILIGAEQMLVSARTVTGSGTSPWAVGITREQNGTEFTSTHSSGANIYKLATGTYAAIPVVSSSGLNGATLKIESEEVTVQSVTGNTLNVKRGQFGTTVAAHSTSNENVLGLAATLINGATLLIANSLEQMTITAVNTTTKTLTVDRGENGTTAASSHADNALVYVLDTTIQVSDSVGSNNLSINQLVKIAGSNEFIQVIGMSGVILTVKRGQNGSTVTAHSNASAAVLGIAAAFTATAPNNTVLVGAEQMTVGVVSTTTNTLTVTRQVNGTTAPSSHADGLPIYVLDTTIPVASNANLVTNQLVKVDSEFMQVTDRGSNTLTVKRGQNSSAVAAHSNASAPVVGIASAFTSATVLVGAEQMTVTGVNTATNTLTVTRQVNSTSEPANNTHANDSPIFILDTTIPVTSSSGLNGLVVQVGTENMNVTGVNGNILTVVRGHGGSTVAAHANSGSAAQVRTGVPASLATGVTALMDAEQITIGTVTAATSTIAVTRAQNNTAAATHADTRPIYPLDVSVPVNSVANIVVGDVLTIGSEALQVSAINNLVLTVVRGVNSTTVSSNGHVDDAVVNIPLTATTPVIKVASVANLTADHVIKVDNEEMAITSISGTQLTVTRGLGNTTAATHTANTTVTSFHVWDDFTTSMTSFSKTASMKGFSTTFRGDNKYIYFGADYKFSGIEFNLKTNGSVIGPTEGLTAEYWNGVAWVAVQDLYSYDFSFSGSMRWDMDTIDAIEEQGTDYSSSYFDPKYQWKKRDIRTSTLTWGNYNYNNTASGAANATRNPYIPPTATEVISSEVTQTASVINGSGTSGGPTGITQFNVDSVANLKKGYWISIGDESMLITGISGNTLTVRRGQLGTIWETSSGIQHPINSIVKTVEPVGGAVFGDGTGAYPAGVGHVNSLDAPHNHLYWMRLRLDGSGAINTPASISTIRMFSRPVLKYFERGTEPWNFNLTGTEETTSATTIYGLPNKFEFNDTNGQFVRSPSNPNVNNSDAFVKNTSAADYSYTNSGVLSASRLGLQPALRRGGVGATGEATVVTVLNGAVNNSSSTTTIVVRDGSGIKVNDYILIDLERMMVTAKSGNTLTVVRAVHNDSANFHQVLTSNAASSQRVVAVASTGTTGFVAGNSVRIYDNNTPAGEAKVIASGGVTSTTITVTSDLANAYTTAASAGILRTGPTDTPEIYFTSLPSYHVNEADVSVLPRTTDLHERLYLSAGIFVPGFPSSDHQGVTGSKYLFYQDKVAGVKSYDVYGGDTSTTGNWHGLRIMQSSSKTNQTFPLYRYSINEVPANITTRVTVNGQDPITFTAIDETAESTYGLKRERVVYDRNIKSKTEAESTAQSILISSKPSTTQTIKQATLEFYEFPVYSYNSATTTSIDRSIPRVLRAGDIIQLTLNEGGYNFTNVPFLVQGLDYDDGKSLCKLSCTEGVYPTSTDMFNISDSTYAAAKQARDTAQKGAVPTGSSSTALVISGTDDPSTATAQITTESSADVLEAEKSLLIKGMTVPGESVDSYETDVADTRTEDEAVAQGNQGFDGTFNTTLALHHHQGAISLAGDTEDILLSGTNALTADSTEDIIVVSKTSPFVARDGGFTPKHIWIGRTVVINPSLGTETTYSITEVISDASIRVDGGRAWSTSDAPVIRKISSAVKNPSISNSGTTLYYDLDQRVLRSRIGNQIVGSSNTDYPLWGTNFTGFHGTKATDSSGIVIIDLVADHGVKQLLTHKPVVIATVDPTDLAGDENTGAVKGAYVVVQKYTTSNNSRPVIAQTGRAGANSGGSILVAQGANATDYSKFLHGLEGSPSGIGSSVSIGDTVFSYDSISYKLLNSGYVADVGVITSGAFVSSDTNPYALTTTGIDNWAVGNIYVVHAQIQKIHLKVYYPALNLLAATISSNVGATDSVLVNAAGTQLYTSDTTARIVSTATAAGAGIGVHYAIIPKANRIDNLPFKLGGKGND